MNTLTEIPIYTINKTEFTPQEYWKKIAEVITITDQKKVIVVFEISHLLNDSSARDLLVKLTTMGFIGAKIAYVLKENSINHSFNTLTNKTNLFVSTALAKNWLMAN